MSPDACIFCRIAGRKIPAKVVFEDGDILAFEDVRPQAPTHILFISKRHIERVSDLTKDDAALMGQIVLSANKVARDLGLKDAGYRMVINCNKDAGQDVYHLHLHLLAGRKFAWPPG